MPTFLEKLGMTWPARAVRGMWEGAKLPGDVYAGRVDPMSDEGLQRALDLAGMGFTGGVGNMARAAAAGEAVDPAVAGMFGGTRTSARAFTDAGDRLYKTARDMYDAIDNPTDLTPANLRKISAETGWFPGPDGRFRFEIPDDGAVFRDGSTAFKGELGDYLEHKRLYEQYPNLATVPLEVNPGMNQARPGMRGGAYVPSRQFGSPNDKGEDLGHIQLWQGDDPRSEGTLLHEIQHIVQGLEGFARGGTGKEPNYWFKTGEVEARDVANRRLDDYRGVTMPDLQRAVATGLGVDEALPWLKPPEGFDSKGGLRKPVSQYEQLRRLDEAMRHPDYPYPPPGPPAAARAADPEGYARFLRQRADLDKRIAAGNPLPWESGGAPMVSFLDRLDWTR